MKLLKLGFLLFLLLLSNCSSDKKENHMNKRNNLKPPIAKKEPYQWEIHQEKLVDQYFWMRLTDEQKNSNTKDKQTQEVWNYLAEENKYTDTILKHTEPLQEHLYQEIVGKIKKDDASVPYFDNGYWYYSKFENEKEYPIYCRKKDSLESQEEIILDVNELAKDHSYYQIGSMHISPDNKILAYCEDTVSRRIYTYKFINLETREYLSDELTNAEPGAAWANDNKHFFYTTKNKVSLLSEAIQRHELGTDAQKDVQVYKEEDETFYIGVYKSKSKGYVIIYNDQTITSQFHILDANTPKEDFHAFTERKRGLEYGIDHFEDKFYIITNDQAENFRLMETSTSKTDQKFWKEVIPHRQEVLLEGIEVFNDFLVLEEKKEGLTQLRVINQSTKEDFYIPFDDPAYTAGIGINRSYDSSKLRFSYSAMNTPVSTFEFDMNSKERTLLKQQEVIGGHDPKAYQVERLFIEVRDGKRVPVSLVYKKDQYKKDGQHPMLLYAYGSYGHSIEPGFGISRLSLLDRGFAFAIAHIRGSQTMGRAWYEDGKMFRKKNTFYDFIDVAKSLSEQQYTSPDHMYAMGGSAGGLLMGAIMNMAPEQFNGIVAAVPFVDVINTMYDETIPLTTNEWDEWGNPKIKEEYDYIKSYSPYDNVTAKDYPHTLVTTGLFDSQVQYWEPAKWVAKLRDLKTDENLLLLKTDMEAGHGGASGRFKRFKDTALEYAFILDLEKITE